MADPIGRFFSSFPGKWKKIIDLNKSSSKDLHLQIPPKEVMNKRLID